MGTVSDVDRMVDRISIHVMNMYLSFNQVIEDIHAVFDMHYLDTKCDAVVVGSLVTNPCLYQRTS